MFKMKAFLLCLLVSPCYGYNILCLLPYHGKSHHMVFEPLLQELIERGHRLTVVSFFPAKPQPNRRDVSLEGLAPLNVEVFNLEDPGSNFLDVYASTPTVKQLALSNLELCRKIINADVFKEFLNAEGDYDLVITEHFNSDCMLGIVYNYGLPSIGLSSCALMPWTPSRVGAPDNPAYVPGMTLPFTQEMTFIERVFNTLFFFYLELWFEAMIRREEKKILEQALGRELPDLDEVGRNTSVVLVNTYYALNGVRNVPPSVVEVGGLHLHKKIVQQLPTDLEDWVSESKHGFIVFSFGTVIRASTMPRSRLEAILGTFQKLPQRIIWKLETDLTQTLPGNVRVMRWVPLYDLLHHPKCVAVITHGGLLTLTETVSAGIPTLVIPILGDQFGNAAHAKRAGVAEVLRLGDLTTDTFHEALRRVLSPEMRTQARAVSEIWKDRPLSPMDTAVFHVERAVRQGRAYSSSHARRLYRFQLALLDVAAFVTTLIVAVIYFLKFILKKFRRKEKQC